MSKYIPSIDLGHIGELHDLDRRLQERGELSGIRPHIVELIARLTSGGVGSKIADPRQSAAKRLWDLGFGTELGVRTFKQYLAKVPPVPVEALVEDSTLPLLRLCDPRPSLIASARMASVRHAELGYSEGNAEPWDARHEDGKEPFWLRAHDGRVNHKRRPSDCRAECLGNLLAGTAKVGLALYAHDQKVVVEDEHVMDLPGSVRQGARSDCAFLKVWGRHPELCLYRSGGAGARFGTVFFRREW